MSALMWLCIVLVAIGLVFAVIVGYACLVMAGRSDDAMEEALRREQHEPQA